MSHDERIVSQFLYKGRRMRRHADVRPEALRRRDRIKDRVQKAVRKLLLRSRAKKILDVGTGFGSNVRLLAHLFHGKGEIWSIDPSPEVLREARRVLAAEELLKNVKLIKGEAENMPFRDRFFDLVTSVMLVHHLVNPRKGLREMVRTMADNAMLVLVDWRPVASEVVPHRARDFPAPEKIRDLLRQLGISVRLRKYHYWYLVHGAKTSD